ncbi:peptide deformylase, partial [Klebsiella pneumoniae]
VMDITAKDEESELIVLINPEISEGEGSDIDEEGCLSVVDLTAKVKRFTKIRVTAQDMEGNDLDFVAEDWFARVIQHEVDHLNGTLFLDHLS